MGFSWDLVSLIIWFGPAQATERCSVPLCHCRCIFQGTPPPATTPEGVVSLPRPAETARHISARARWDSLETLLCKRLVGVISKTLCDKHAGCLLRVCHLSIFCNRVFLLRKFTIDKCDNCELVSFSGSCRQRSDYWDDHLSLSWLSSLSLSFSNSHTSTSVLLG